MYKCKNCGATFDDKSELQKCLKCGGSLIKQGAIGNSNFETRNTPVVNSTKECPHCKTSIPKGANKCPNCQSDLRSWFRRHPILTFFLVLFGLPIVLASLTGDGGGRSAPSSIGMSEPEATVTNVNIPVEENKSIDDKEFNARIEALRDDMKENLNKSIGDGGIFEASSIRRFGDDLELELTVNDDWYHFAKYQQDRLLEDAWQYFNLLGVKYSLREEDSLPWKVRFVDIYEKKVAEQGWW